MHTNPEVLALLALGEEAGSPAERQHATTCPACSEEVAELARIADVGRMSHASDALSAPSPEVWRRISAQLGFDAPGDVLTRSPASRSAWVPAGGSSVTQLSPRRLPAEDPAPRRAGAARRFGALALAAAFALVVGIGVGISYERRVTAPETRVIASADLKPLPQYAGASGTAEVTADGRGGRDLIVRMSSPKPINGTVQVWLMDSKGDPTLMGEMKDGKAVLPIQRGMSLFLRPTIDVSDEPVNDPDPQAHNGTSILRGVLI